MTASLCRFNLKIALKSDVDYRVNVFLNHTSFLITDAVANLDLVCKKKKRKILIPSHRFIFYAYQLCIVIIIQDS